MDNVLNYIKLNKNKVIDINYLINLIDNIIMIKKRDLTQRIKYDPSIFN